MHSVHSCRRKFNESNEVATPEWSVCVVPCVQCPVEKHNKLKSNQPGIGSLRGEAQLDSSIAPLPRIKFRKALE